MSSLPVNHLSHSQLGAMRDCMRVLEYRYVLHFPRRAHPADMATGQAIAKTTGEDYTARIEKGSYLADEAIVDIAAGHWERETFMVDWRIEEDTPGKSKDGTIAMARAHHREVAPTVSPVAVEFPMRAPLNHSGLELIGYADVVSECRVGIRVVRGQDEKRVLRAGRHVRDTKSSGKAPNGAGKGKIDISTRHMTQLATYKILLAAMGLPTTECWIDYCWPTKGGQAKAEKADIPDHEVRLVLEEYASLITVYEKGLFPRTGRGGRLCKPGKCDYYEHCILGTSRATNL